VHEFTRLVLVTLSSFIQFIITATLPEFPVLFPFIFFHRSPERNNARAGCGPGADVV